MSAEFCWEMAASTGRADPGARPQVVPSMGDDVFAGAAQLVAHLKPNARCRSRLVPLRVRVAARPLGPLFAVPPMRLVVEICWRFVDASDPMKSVVDFFGIGDSEAPSRRSGGLFLLRWHIMLCALTGADVVCLARIRPRISRERWLPLVVPRSVCFGLLRALRASPAAVGPPAANVGPPCALKTSVDDEIDARGIDSSGTDPKSIAF